MISVWIDLEWRSFAQSNKCPPAIAEHFFSWLIVSTSSISSAVFIGCFFFFIRLFASPFPHSSHMVQCTCTNQEDIWYLRSMQSARKQTELIIEIDMEAKCSVNGSALLDSDEFDDHISFPIRWTEGRSAIAHPNSLSYGSFHMRKYQDRTSIWISEKRSTRVLSFVL